MSEINEIRFLSSIPKRGDYYVVSEYKDEKVFWYAAKGWMGITPIESFVEYVKRGQCKTVVITDKNAIKPVKLSFIRNNHDN
ncbi:hypothetical protein [Chroococcidiopsis sp.]|uniref:hypothetical protein n=1 Tax=Chroococcidiopsis sp. TaxID=3088168 RepID=UPI003F3965C3